jgi:hypothetical protein
MADQEALVQQQTTQPGEVPQTQAITGWLSESSQPNHQRVLLDPVGNRYLEIPTDDIVLTRSLDSADSSTGLGGSTVFVKQNAQILYCRVRAMSLTDYQRLRRAAARLVAAPPQPAGATTRSAFDPFAIGAATMFGSPAAGAAVGTGLQMAQAAGFDPIDETVDFIGGFF